MDKQSCGAQIERGRIYAANDGTYRVESLTRYGIITPFLPTIGGELFQIGEIVEYFMFDDGDGRIFACGNISHATARVVGTTLYL